MGAVYTAAQGESDHGPYRIPGRRLRSAGAWPGRRRRNATVVIQTDPQHGPHAVYPAAQVLPPPPPPRYERTPAPRRNMVWSQGHWEWRGQRYAWVPGQWVRVRHGQYYRQPHWEQRGERWHFAPGRWDRDGDGVPNRHDRRPHDPRRY